MFRIMVEARKEGTRVNTAREVEEDTTKGTRSIRRILIQTEESQWTTKTKEALASSKQCLSHK